MFDGTARALRGWSWFWLQISALTVQTVLLSVWRCRCLVIDWWLAQVSHLLPNDQSNGLHHSWLRINDSQPKMDGCLHWIKPPCKCLQVNTRHRVCQDWVVGFYVWKLSIRFFNIKHSPKKDCQLCHIISKGIHEFKQLTFVFFVFFKDSSQAFNVPTNDLFVLAAITSFSYSHSPA